MGFLPFNKESSVKLKMISKLSFSHPSKGVDNLVALIENLPI